MVVSPGGANLVPVLEPDSIVVATLIIGNPAGIHRTGTTPVVMAPVARDICASANLLALFPARNSTQKHVALVESLAVFCQE